MSTQPTPLSRHLPIDLLANPALLTAPDPARPTLLMCPPDLYDVDYVINPWMQGNLHTPSRARATRQWQALRNTLATIAEVLIVKPQPGSPDMVFTANAGLERDGTVVLSSFFHPERQAEEDHFRRWFRHARYTVVDLPKVDSRRTPFEGEGDALFSAGGTLLFAGSGPRTHPASHRALGHAFGVDVITLELVDPRFYHLDTCFAPLSDGSLLYYPAAFSRESRAAIEAVYPRTQRLAVSEPDATRFACNAVNIGQSLILNCIGKPLQKRLEDRGFNVAQLEMSEFLKAGGAAKCLVMKLTKPTL